jgi:hypothetical protein
MCDHRAPLGIAPLWQRAAMEKARMPDEHVALISEEAFDNRAALFDLLLKKRGQETLGFVWPRRIVGVRITKLLQHLGLANDRPAMGARHELERAGIRLDLVKRHPDGRVVPVYRHRVQIIVLVPVSFGADPTGEVEMKAHRLSDQLFQQVR